MPSILRILSETSMAITQLSAFDIATMALRLDWEVLVPTLE